MKKNQIQNIIVHISDETDFRSLADKVNNFHAEVIERGLKQSALTAEQKLNVIDRIIENMKSREANGIIG